MQDVIHDLQVIEQDVIDVEQKCEKVNCKAFYDAVIATIKLIYDILFCCCKKKKTRNKQQYYQRFLLLFQWLNFLS